MFKKGDKVRMKGPAAYTKPNPKIIMEGIVEGTHKMKDYIEVQIKYKYIDGTSGQMWWYDKDVELITDSPTSPKEKFKGVDFLGINKQIAGGSF